MKIVDLIEKLGWKAAFALLLLVLGFVVATNQEIKNGFDLAIPSDQKVLIGSALVISGLFFVIVSILEAQKSSPPSSPNGGDELTFRREALETVQARINQHRALEEQDPEDFVSRLYLSAQRLRDKLHDLHVDKSVHPAGRELAYKISMSAARFLSDLEPIEIRSHVNLAKDDVTTHQLEEDDRQRYLRALGRWRENTWALLEGAELMLKTPA